MASQFTNQSRGSEAPRLTDGVIVLDQFTLEDVEQHLANEDGATRLWLNESHTSTQKSVTDWITRNEAYWRDGGPIFCFAIRTVDDSTLAGMTELSLDIRSQPLLKPGEANVSYALAPAARGRGLASRAVTLLEAFASTRGVHRLFIRADERNTASLGLAQRLGYDRLQDDSDEQEAGMVAFSKYLS